MSYSLVSASALGFDLTRTTSGGAAVAAVLLAGLSADSDQLWNWAAANPASAISIAERPDVMQLAAHERADESRLTPRLRNAVEELDYASDSAARRDLLLHRLSVSALADVGGLDCLITQDVLGSSSPAVRGVPSAIVELAADFLSAAAAAAWRDVPVNGRSASTLPSGPTSWFARRSLVGVVSPSGTTGIDLGPLHLEVADRLARVQGLTESDRDAWRASSIRDPSIWKNWSSAMHESCWAGHLSGRTRTLAVAQLLAVRAFFAGGFTARDARCGVWNALSGYIQAAAVSDLLGSSAVAILENVAPRRSSPASFALETRSCATDG